MARHLFIFLSVIFLGAILIFGVSKVIQNSSQKETTNPKVAVSGNDTNKLGVKVGDKLPTFVLTTIDGKQINSEELKGKVIVIEGISTTCVTCIIETKDLAKIYPQLKDKAFFVSIVVDPIITADSVRKFQKDTQASWNFVIASENKNIINQLGLYELTMTFIFDQAEILRYKDAETTSQETFIKEVEQWQKI